MEDKKTQELVTIDYIHFNSVLINMVKNGQISKSDRDILLHKSGLTKLEDGTWKQNNNNILKIKNNHE